MRRDLLLRRPILILVALTALFYWKLVFAAGQFTYLESPDLTGQVLPWYEVQARAWNRGLFPMWDPYVWAGQPLQGQMQPGAAFPLNWPLFAAPLENGSLNWRFLNWHFAFLHLLAALFAYALARELGRSRFASLLAGLAYACGGYIGTVAWPQMLGGAIWLPLTLLLFHRAARCGWNGSGVAWAALAGGSVGLSLLSGHHQTPFFSLLALTGMFLYFLAAKARESPREAAGLAALFAVIGAAAFLVGSLQLLPAWEYGRDAYRWIDLPDPIRYPAKTPYVGHYEQRLYPVSLLGAVVPNASFQVSTHVGVVCLALALLALATTWKERWTKLYAGLTLAVLAFAFGPLSLLHGWVYAFVPMADKARSAGHAVFIAQLGLFLLAARGVDRLLEGLSDDESWLARLRTALVIFGAACWALILALASVGTMEAHPGDQLALAGLTAFLLAALLEAERRGALSARALGLPVVALMLYELAVPQWFFLTDRSDPNRSRWINRFEQYSGAMSYLKEQPRPFRFEMVPDGGQINIGALHGIEQVGGFLASVNGDLFDFLDRTDWAKAQLMLNTVYTVAKEETREGQQEVYADPSSGWKVFRNPDASPRAWLAHDLSAITNAQGGQQDLPRPANCEGEDEVAAGESGLHWSLFRVRTPCAGYLIVGDPYWKGWRADIDGRETEVYRAHGALRAVFVPAGESTVRFRYRPVSVILGGSLTAVGFALCLGAAAFLRRRR